MPAPDLDRAPLGTDDRAALERLRAILRALDRPALAFSGGVDSSLLLAVAAAELGTGLAAVTAVSPTYPPHELRFAQDLASGMGVRHLIIESRELELPEFIRNPRDRCYHCKKLRFGEMQKWAAAHGYASLIDGSNTDDLSDYRPGRRAAEELGAKSPLLEAGFDKARVRRVSAALGLPGWDRPAEACYATRFPPGVEISEDRLARVAEAEESLHALGFRMVRVRFHGDLARIELVAEDLARALDPALRRQIVAAVHAAGFHHATLDLVPYRPGGAG